jgi:hypothetical protein
MRRRFVIGLLCGAIFSLSTIASAKPNFKVEVFPAKFLFNHKAVDMPADYQVFNEQGRAYVPIRFLAENMQSYIHYNSQTETIEVQYLDPAKPIYSDWQGYFPQVKVGNVTYKVIGENTEITGDYTVYNDKSTNTVAFSLAFMDENGAEIGKAAGGGDLAAGEVGHFAATVPGIIKENMEVKMELGIFNHVVKRN